MYKVNHNMRSPYSYMIISMLILGVLLSAIAMWSDTLKINGVVKTGDVDISFEGYKVVEGNEFGKPWVADCIVNLNDVENEDLGNAAGNNDLDLNITVVNGYPGYSCTVYFNVSNTGTVPVIGPFYEMPVIPEGINIMFEPMLLQLHPGEKASYEIYLEVLQAAEQGTSYNVQLHLSYIQWNEVAVAIKSATISGYAFNDTNGNSVWDPNEDPLPGVYIELYDDHGNKVGEACTDNNGYYTFMVYPLTLRQYTIKATALPNYQFTTSFTLLATVSPGSHSTDNNFGLRRLPPQLTVTKDFRYTDVDVKKCPAKLGTPLNSIEVEVPNKGPYKGKIRSVDPGAFYGVIQISGEGITQISITDRYDFHFDVEDGEDGKVHVYLLNSSKCVTELDSYSYTVDNTNNVVTVSINLGRPLRAGETILVYLKFKPVPELVGSDWASLSDKQFDNVAYVVTNIGSKSVSASIPLEKK